MVCQRRSLLGIRCLQARIRAVFVIDKSRKRKVVLSMLEEFDGIVVSDSFGAWNPIGCMQQKCPLRYFQDMYRTKEKRSSPEFCRFFSTLYRILKGAKGAKRDTAAETPKNVLEE